MSVVELPGISIDHTLPGDPIRVRRGNYGAMLPQAMIARLEASADKAN